MPASRACAGGRHRRPAVVCVCVFAIALSAAPTARGQDQVDGEIEESPPLRQPDGIFTYPGDTQIRDIILAPDGRSAYAVFAIGSVNIWAVLVYHWVEIAAAVIGVTVALMLWRVVRRRREIGQPHCRRCNYLLVNFSGTACPECGVELADRNRVMGRPRRWRIAMFSGLLAAVGAGYLGGRSQLPREGQASTWFYWLSPRLYDWAWHHGQGWLHNHKAWLSRVVEIDLQSGRIERTLYQRNGGTARLIMLHPSGETLFVLHRNTISHHDLETAKQIDVLSVRDAAPLALRDHLRSFSTDAEGQTLFALSDREVVWRWRLADGHREQLFQLPDDQSKPRAYLTLVRRRPELLDVRWAMIRGDGSIVLDISVWDLEKQKITRSFAVDIPGGRAWEGLSADGRFLLVFQMLPPSVQVWDIESAELRTVVEPSRGVGAAYVMSRDQRFLVTATTKPAELQLWDAAAQARVALFGGPVRHWARLILSDDNRVLVAIGIDTTKGHVQTILTYDISDVVKAEEAERPSD